MRVVNWKRWNYTKSVVAILLAVFVFIADNRLYYNPNSVLWQVVMTCAAFAMGFVTISLIRTMKRM